MTKDNPRATRHFGNGGKETITYALVGHHPEPGERRAVALQHSASYSAVMFDDAKSRLNNIAARIAKAAASANRDPAGISMIAISKTYPQDTIHPLLEAGHRIFGENRVQESQAKWPALLEEFPEADLHLVGQLQSNKAEGAVALFSAIHSVDRLSLVGALARAQDKYGKRPRCFLQVNIGDQTQKGGCVVRDLSALIAEARNVALDLAGLMAVPPADLEPAPYFALLSKLAHDQGLDGLSMGMSGDFETAVMLGATHVRVGTALFGART